MAMARTRTENEITNILGVSIHDQDADEVSTLPSYSLYEA